MSETGCPYGIPGIYRDYWRIGVKNSCGALNEFAQRHSQRVRVGIWYILRAQRVPIYLLSGLSLYHMATWTLWDLQDLDTCPEAYTVSVSGLVMARTIRTNRTGTRQKKGKPSTLNSSFHFFFITLYSS